MSKPTNTSEPMEIAHVLAIAMGGGAIEAMEARCQRELVESTSLPTRLLEEVDLVKIEAMGITLGEPYADDPLFCEATMPDGWKLELSDHSMWSYIVDADGKRRVAVFYKAAHYDRRAHMSVAQAEAQQ